ncbi:Rha family transcriptional regulator [Pseudomonas aeruginosa]|uniref:Rha family transcriptional regulator n=1 Tax=Pseudomonas aeruginosa TaxID=287 RepID=UPI0022EB1C3E|nr:Rha family transcriptional regulator [Pseudomonas aeruginosa]
MSEIDLDEASLRDLVMVNDGQVVTTSLKVAERFGKRHDNVLRAIDNLDCSAGFRLLNFEETVMWRENPSGGEPIKSRSFDMTKDGFMFLVMGFRGKAAAAWKEAFIHAFNWMAALCSSMKCRPSSRKAAGYASGQASGRETRRISSTRTERRSLFLTR